MSVEIRYFPTEGFLHPVAGTSTSPLLTQRLEVGGALAIALSAGNEHGIALLVSEKDARRHNVLFVLVDLGGHRTLLYIMGDHPVYLDGEDVQGAVLRLISPSQQYVIRSEAFTGCILVAPAQAIRAPAAANGTCAYCGGPFKAGELVVTCSCSAQAIVHGEDEVDCWKRSPCTTCSWSLSDAKAADQPGQQEVIHGAA